jgi:membrane protein YqaA with SNARE-associated domain
LVPIITDPFMVAYIVLNRARTFVAVIVTTATSVLGGLAAYFMARFFSDLVMPWLGPETLTYFEQLAVQIQNEIFVLTILGAVTPIPFTLVCLAAGFVSGNVWVFIIASILGRGFRYGVVGYLTYRFGAQATAHIKRNVRFATVGTIVLVGLYIAYKFF